MKTSQQEGRNLKWKKSGIFEVEIKMSFELEIEALKIKSWNKEAPV